MLKKITALVQSQGHCVLATCGPDGPDAGGVAPHASLMSFCAPPDCGEFWLAAHADSRKCRNLRANPRASLLFDDRAPGDETGGGAPSRALGVDVRPAPFAGAAQEAAARHALLGRHPSLAAFLGTPGVFVLRFVALRFQLLTGLVEVFTVEAEKVLDASAWKA